MAATTFAEIFDIFATLQTDYRLTNLYNASVTDYQTALQGWLIPAINDFDNCDQSLAYSSTTFTETLTDKNIVMLAKIMKKYWLEKEVDDILQMNLHVTDHDFKIYSEAQNMQAKRLRLMTYKEELSQAMVDYSLKINPWREWWLGTFYDGVT